MAVDLKQLHSRARLGYELGRARHALMAASLLLPALGVAVAIAPRFSVALTGAVLAWVAAFVALWRGESFGRGVMPGIVAAVFPLLSSHLAARIGHICTGDGCYSLCTPLCSGGGVAAGLVLAYWIRREKSAAMAFASGALLVLAVGATSCTCIGVGGVVGIAAGLSVGFVRLLLGYKS